MPKDGFAAVATSCRVCGHNSISIFSLGNFYISDFLDGTREQVAKKAPPEIMPRNKSEGVVACSGSGTRFPADRSFGTTATAQP